MNDNIDKLGLALYGRKVTPSEFLGGSNATILGDAADEIDRLKAENAALRKIAVAIKIFSHRPPHKLVDEAIAACESQHGPLQTEKGGE